MSKKNLRIAMFVALALALVLSTAALAIDYKILVWTGQGSGSERCDLVGQGQRTEDGWIHWIVTSAKGVTFARLDLSADEKLYEPTKYGPVLEFFTPYYDLKGLQATLYYLGQLGKNTQFVISDYCPVVYKPLGVEKTASGSYERTVTWDLKKYVNTVGTKLAEYTGEAGDTFTPDWLLYVDKTETLGNYNVTGTITITNPNKIAVDFKVDDVLDDGTVAMVDCDPLTIGNQAFGTVPAFGSITCTYEAKPATGAATNNTATVTALTPYVKGGMAVAPFTYKEILKGVDSGTLTDDRFPSFSETVTGDANFTLPETFTCSTNPSDYNEGKYTKTYNNEGKLVVDKTLTDTAAVKLTCTLPALKVEKTAAGTYDRTVTWDLKKYVNTVGTKLAEYTGKAGDEFTPDWLLYVDKTEVLSNYKVTGTITITNPAAIAQTFAIEDYLDDGSVAKVTCPSLTVAAGAKVECTYTADVTDKATKNTAKVTAVGNDPQYGYADITYKETLKGVDSGTLTDDRFPSFSETVSGDANFKLPETFTCSKNPGDYTDGQYTKKYDNEGKLVVDVTLKDTAAVKLTCTLPALEVKKDAAGTYDRTVTWDLKKYVNAVGTELAVYSGGPGDTFNPTWLLFVDKNEKISNYKVTGMIWVYNPAAIAQTFAIEDYLDDGSVADVTCPSLTVAAGATVECTYTAATTAAATKNTVKVTAIGNAPQYGYATFTWKEKLIGYDSGKLTDDRFPSFSETVTGDANFSLSEPLSCSEDLTKYTDGFYSYDVVNWAYLNGNINLKDDATVTVECHLKFYDETAWAANGDKPGELPYPGANWATYVAYEPKTVTLFAGKTMPAGTVTFSTVADGKVTITLNLTGAWLFDPFEVVTLHVQDYAVAPTVSNPAPGQFAYTAACTGKTCVIVVPANNYYGVHANVGYWGK